MPAEVAKTRCPRGHQQALRICDGTRYCPQCESETAKRKRRAGGKVIVLHADKTHCPKGHAYDTENTRVSLGSRFCRACDLACHIARADARPELQMWRSARNRALKYGVPFAIRPEDICIPPCCPVLGIPLRRKTGPGPSDGSPSLDRIEPDKGYVVGNVIVISFRANRIKSNATLAELELITAWLGTTLRRYK